MSDAWIGLSALQHGLLNHAGVAGVGGPHIVVASADASDERKTLAQYVCDGTADEVQINQAVDDLCPAGKAWGGTVHLLEGDYNLAGTIDLRYVVNLTGEGWENTWLYYDANGDAAVMDTSSPYNEEYVIIKLGSGRFVSDLWINQYNYSATGFRGGIRMDGEGSMLDRVKIELDSNPTTQPKQNSAVRMQGESCVVRNCWIEAWDGTGIDLAADQDYCRIESNFIGAGLGIDGNGTPTAMILGNHLMGGGADCATVYSYLGDPTYGWVCGSGIVIWAGGGECYIANNRVEGFAKHGIALDSVDNCTVLGNYVLECSQSNSGEYSGIQVRNGCYANAVTGNTVRGDYHKYGLDIADPVDLPAFQDDPSYNTWAFANNLLDGATNYASLFHDAGIETAQLLIFSPNNTQYRILAANDGTLSMEAV